MELPELVDIDNTEPVLDGADGEEKSALHKQMVQDMQVGSGHAVEVADSDTQSNVAELGYTGVSQHTAEICLIQSHNGSEDHTQGSQNADQSRGINDYQVLDSENEEEEPDHGQGRHLTHGT